MAGILRVGTVRWARLIGLSGLIAGCGSKTGLLVPPLPCDRTFDSQRAPASVESRVFVIDSLTIDSNDNPDLPHTGFNLDGLYSLDREATGCFRQDFFSATDDDQHCASVRPDGSCSIGPGCAMLSSGCRGGVDNMLPTIAATAIIAGGIDIRAPLTERIRRNRLALILRITGASDSADTEAVGVFLYVGFPTFDTNCDSVQPNRVYSIARDSLIPGGTTLDDAVFAYRGTITRGRLSVDSGSVGTFAFSLDLGGRGDTGPSLIHRVRLAFDVTPSELNRGVLGGWIEGSEFVRIFSDVLSRPAAEAIYAGISDLRENCMCALDAPRPRTIGRVSLGWGFHAVAALISTASPIADSQPSGTCGAP
jgi:hypothetical protein